MSAGDNDDDQGGKAQRLTPEQLADLREAVEKRETAPDSEQADTRVAAEGERVCGGCRHFKPWPAPNNQRGLCKENSPTPVLVGIQANPINPAKRNLDVESIWPPVGDQWGACGCWTPKIGRTTEKPQ
jgi:hypothetical protein